MKEVEISKDNSGKIKVYFPYNLLTVYPLRRIVTGKINLKQNGIWHFSQKGNKQSCSVMNELAAMQRTIIFY